MIKRLWRWRAESELALFSDPDGVFEGLQWIRNARLEEYWQGFGFGGMSAERRQHVRRLKGNASYIVLNKIGLILG